MTVNTGRIEIYTTVKARETYTSIATAAPLKAEDEVMDEAEMMTMEEILWTGVVLETAEPVSILAVSVMGAVVVRVMVLVADTVAVLVVGTVIKASKCQSEAILILLLTHLLIETSPTPERKQWIASGISPLKKLSKPSKEPIVA